MFTGIVQSVGRVAARDESPGHVRFRIAGAAFLDRLAPGDSVAVDGACLTVAELDGESFAVEAVRTTLERTTLAEWREGRRVNLEPSLRAGDPLGGHMVQGHVDGVAEVLEARSTEEGREIALRLPADVAEVTVPRGSLAVDGVSLTVGALDGVVARFAIIPYTWSHTTLGRLEEGARVNVEADVLGKYVSRVLDVRGHGRPGA